MSENASAEGADTEHEDSTESSESEDETYESSYPECPSRSDKTMKIINIWHAVAVIKSLQHHDITRQFELISEERAEAEKILNLQTKKIHDNRQAIDVLEDWLRDYREKNRHEKNLDYLPIETIEAFRPLAKNYDIFMYDDFYRKYKEGSGDYKTLRTAKTNMDCWGTDTWDILRNEWLDSIISNMRSKNIGWYDWYTADWCQDNKGLPSREHTRCILLGYSPDPEKLEELIPKIAKRFESCEQSKSDDDEEEENQKELKLDETERRKKKSFEGNNVGAEHEKKEEAEEHVHNIECDSPDTETDAIRSLKRLDGRDPTYQFQLVELYHCRAKKILKRNKRCLDDSQRCVQHFDDWLDSVRESNWKETNEPYLPIGTIEAFRPLAHSYGLYAYRCFYENYKKVNGDCIALRVAQTNKCKCIGATDNWNVRRNEWLHEIRHHDRTSSDNLYVTQDNVYKGFPTKGHVRMILLGYSPDPEKLMKLIPEIAGKFQLLDSEESCVDSAYSAAGLIDAQNHGQLETLPPSEALDILENVLNYNSRRDINFQFEIVGHYLGCAGKLFVNQEQDIQRNFKSIAQFNDWLREYKEKNREKELLPYLPLGTVEAFRPLGRCYGITGDNFYEAYKAVDGNYKVLRGTKVKLKNYHGETTWDVWRNDCLNHIIGQFDSDKRKNVVWYGVESNGILVPSKEHVQCILLGYSPKPDGLATLIPRISDIWAQKKRVRETTPEDHSSDDEEPRKIIKQSPKFN